MTRENPSIPWCSNCGSMMSVLGEPKKGFIFPPLTDLWFECFECNIPDKIPYYEGQERVKKQKENFDVRKK